MSHITDGFPDSGSCTGPDSDSEYQDLGINGLEDQRQDAREEGEGMEQRKSGFAQIFQKRYSVRARSEAFPRSQ